MSEINEALGVHGAGFPLAGADGVVWHFCHPTKARQGEMEAWVQARVLARQKSLKPHLDPEDYQFLLGRLQDKIDHHQYDLGQPGFEAELRTAEGQLFFLQILLREKHPKVTRADAERLLRDDPEGVAAVLRQLFPNAAAPAATAGRG